MSFVFHRGFRMQFMPVVVLAFHLYSGADGILMCDGETPLFFKAADHRLKLADLRNSIDVGDNYTSVNACREACINYTQWLCLSFLYRASTHKCSFYKTTQQTDKLQVSIGLDYYEAYCSKPGVRPSRKLPEKVLTGEKQIPWYFEPGAIAGLSVGAIAIVILVIAIVIIVICKIRKKKRRSTDTNDKQLRKRSRRHDNNMTGQSHLATGEARGSDLDDRYISKNNAVEGININPTYQASPEVNDDMRSSSASQGGPDSEKTSSLKSPSRSTPGAEPAETYYVELDDIQQRKKNNVQVPPDTDRSVVSHGVDDTLRAMSTPTDEMESHTIYNELYGT